MRIAFVEAVGTVIGSSDTYLVLSRALKLLLLLLMLRLLRLLKLRLLRPLMRR
jgi:hypothetical protein